MEHAGGDGSGDGDGERRGAGRGRGRTNWAPTQQHQQEHLRRPRHTNNANQSPAGDEEGYYKARNSNLSADAPIFVPRSTPGPQTGWTPRPQDRINMARNQHYPQHHQQQQMQHQMTHHHGSHRQPYNYQHVPYQGYQYGDQDAGGQGYPPYEGGYGGNYNRQHGSERHTENNQPASFPGVIRQLESAIDTLNRSPGQFDDLVVPLVCSITPHLKNASHTQEIVDLIVKQSIKESNFRYSGARLCAHLDAIDAPSDDSPSLFRNALYTRCREETEAETLRWQQEPNEKSNNGMMLCLAELVAQLDQSAGSILGKLLVQFISVTLKNPQPNSAKYICQCLKLAGQYLERDSSTNRDEIERVMRELTELVTEGRVDVHVGRMVNSVRELRSGNWGRLPSHGPTPVEQSPAIEQLPQHLLDEPVLYGPDGTVLSAEESSFCQSRATVDGIGDDGNESVCEGLRKLQTELGNTPQSYEDDEEDDAIAAAYEEFLKLPPNKSGSSAVDRG